MNCTVLGLQYTMYFNKFETVSEKRKNVIPSIIVVMGRITVWTEQNSAVWISVNDHMLIELSIKYVINSTTKFVVFAAVKNLDVIDTQVFSSLSIKFNCSCYEWSSNLCKFLCYLSATTDFTNFKPRSGWACGLLTKTQMTPICFIVCQSSSLCSGSLTSHRFCHRRKCKV